MQAKHSIRDAPMIGYESERYYFAQNSLHPVLPDRMILIYPAGQEKKRCFNGSGDSICSAQKGFIGRVSVVFAITNPNLEGTYCAKATRPPAANKLTITVKSLLPGTVLPSYTVKIDPNLAVANGRVTSMSGFSDVGGQNSVVSLGLRGLGSSEQSNMRRQHLAGQSRNLHARARSYAWAYTRRNFLWLR